MPCVSRLKGDIFVDSDNIPLSFYFPSDVDRLGPSYFGLMPLVLIMRMLPVLFAIVPGNIFLHGIKGTSLNFSSSRLILFSISDLCFSMGFKLACILFVIITNDQI
jgi:hypothetical protein